MTEARFTTDGGVALVLVGKGPRPARVELVGRRARVEGVLSGRGATWRAALPLTAARWGGPRLPLPTGDYRVRVTATDGAEAEEELDGLPMTMLGTVRA
ncbi:MAG: glycosyl/glycerophosphate transferase, partial [Microbacterium sp.]|nr:glycosyl/glycerophosphate transferase [Microbacterium sp.]